MSVVSSGGRSVGHNSEKRSGMCDHDGFWTGYFVVLDVRRRRAERLIEIIRESRSVSSYNV